MVEPNETPEVPDDYEEAWVTLETDEAAVEVDTWSEEDIEAVFGEE